MKNRIITEVLLLLAFLPFIVRAQSIQQTAKQEQATKIHGIAFSPYGPGQVPGKTTLTEEQIEQRLQIVAPWTQWVRSYGAFGGLEYIPRVAKESGLKVAMGTWIRHNREQELDNMITASQDGYVDLIFIGNEELYAREHGHEASISHSTYMEVLQEARRRLNNCGCEYVPVALAEPWTTLLQWDSDGAFRYGEFIAQADVIGVNIYPYHDGIHIERSIEYMETIYKQVSSAIHEISPGKRIIITETGWPSAGETKDLAVPSAWNQRRFFYLSTGWARENNIDLYFFEAFDENWKRQPGAECEGHWGLWDANGIAKFRLDPVPTLRETFDGLEINDYCVRKSAYLGMDPNIMDHDEGSDGCFLRLMHDEATSHYTSIAFPAHASGTYPQITLTFDFRMSGPDQGQDADGFNASLIPTSDNGMQGCSHQPPFPMHGYFAEIPRLSNTFAIGFDIYIREGTPGNRICISWDGNWYPFDEQIDVPIDIIDLDSGVFHHAQVDLLWPDCNSALVRVELTPDIYDPNHGSAWVTEATIPSLRPYEHRLEFAGRNGGRTINVDLDNVYLSYPCLSEDHPDFLEWASLGAPACWCDEQPCPTDQDCLIADWVGDACIDEADLDILFSCWKLHEPPHGPGIETRPECLCADLDHSVEGNEESGFYRVGINDLGILMADWRNSLTSQSPE